jgi:hypothetical protein
LLTAADVSMAIARGLAAPSRGVGPTSCIGGVQGEDKFQDVDAAQLRLVRILAAPEDNLFVVGDDDQAWYAWRRTITGSRLPKLGPRVE